MEERTAGRIIEMTLANSLAVVATVTFTVCLGYVVYMRFFHPLAKYPGPFIASLTNLWKAYTMFQGQMEYVIKDLHDRHGAIVRIGPNDLVISHPDAVKQIYLSGSAFQKVVTPRGRLINRLNFTMASRRFDQMSSELRTKVSTPSAVVKYLTAFLKFLFFKWNHT